MMFKSIKPEIAYCISSFKRRGVYKFQKFRMRRLLDGAFISLSRFVPVVFIGGRRSIGGGVK